MANKHVRAIRRATKQRVNKFLNNILTLPFGKRLAIAWRIVKGK